MDDIDQALNQDAGEVTSESTTPVDEPKATEEVETPSAEPEATVEGETEETETETEEAPKKGAQSRIRELNAKAKSAEEKAKSLEQKLAELTGRVDQAPQVPQIPQIDATKEVTPEQYQQHVQQTADALVTLRIKQSESVNRINSEAKEAVRIYPQLDPDSDQFDKELSESVTEATEAYVRMNPYSASPLKFVEKMMKPYQRAVAKEVGKERENIAKQVSQSATRPTSITTKGGKSYDEMTPEELEKTLGIHQY